MLDADKWVLQAASVLVPSKSRGEERCHCERQGGIKYVDWQALNGNVPASSPLSVAAITNASLQMKRGTLDSQESPRGHFSASCNGVQKSMRAHAHAHAHTHTRTHTHRGIHSRGVCS